MSPFDGKVALITGASSGIGKAIACMLAKQGATLHLVGRNQSALQEVAAQARSATVHDVNLADDAAMSAFQDAVPAAIGSLDLLIHSAGVITLAPIAEAPIEDLDWNYRVNLRAPCLLSQALVPALRRSKGQIAFVNSGAGHRANPGWGHYAASKFGLRALADSLRAELAPDGIRVVTIYPTRTATPMQARVREIEGISYDPLHYTQPEDVAATLCHALALPRSANLIELTLRPGPRPQG